MGLRARCRSARLAARPGVTARRSSSAPATTARAVPSARAEAHPGWRWNAPAPSRHRAGIQPARADTPAASRPASDSGCAARGCAACGCAACGCAAAHPLELGDSDAFDGRRRQVRVVHRPRRHGWDGPTVGPVRTTGYCAARAPLSMHCACAAACVQALRRVCRCVWLCADVRGELHLCTCRRGRRSCT